MPWNIANAVIDQITLNSQNGTSISIIINFHYTDGLGITRTSNITRNLTPAEQTTVNNFLNNVANALATQTGLTITLN